MNEQALPPVGDLPPSNSMLPHLFLEVRLAALLLAHGGRLSGVEARRLVRGLGCNGSLGQKTNGSNRGSRAGVAVYRAMKRLRAEDLVRRDGDDYVTDDLLDVAGWIADQVEVASARTGLDQDGREDQQ